MKTYKVFLKKRNNNKRYRKIIRVEDQSKLIDLIYEQYFNTYKPMRCHLLKDEEIIDKYKFIINDEVLTLSKK